MFDTLSNKEMIEVVSENTVGRLACHADDKTYIVPISYAYNGNYIYFRAFEGLKISMMRKNPKVCFQVDSLQNMSDWKSVVIWGTFEELTNEKERGKGLEILLARKLPSISSEMVRFTQEWPFPAKDLKQIEGIVFRIHVNEMTGRCEKPDTESYRK